jgi:hypothetical protein
MRSPSDGAFFLPASAQAGSRGRIVDQGGLRGGIKGMRLATACFAFALPCLYLAGCSSNVTTVFGEGGAGGDGGGNTTQNGSGQNGSQVSTGPGTNQTSTGQATSQTSTGQGTVATTASVGPATTVTVGSTGSGMTCDDTFDCENCIQCATQTSCAMQWTACEQSTECAAYYMCLEDCQNFPDPDPCYNECGEAYPQGAALYYDAVVCIICDTCPNSCANGGC